MLFPLHNKFVRLSNASRIRRIAPSLRNYIDQELPGSRLRRVAQSAHYCFLPLLGPANSSANGGSRRARSCRPTGDHTVITSWLRARRIRD